MNATTPKALDPDSSVAEDPRLALVYHEAVRGLVHQQNVVDSLNNRAGNLIFATAFVTSLLGARALTDGVGLWDWVARGAVSDWGPHRVRALTVLQL